MSRPDRLLAVCGTATEIGKTWVACHLLEALQHKGMVLSARKPVQSFEPGASPTDADRLAAATGERADVVCGWSMPVALAPPMAAARLGVPCPSLADLAPAFPDGVHLGLVETVGGLRSPIAADGDSLDLVKTIGPDVVVLVAHAGLGTINDVRLSVAALAGRWPVVVHLNRFDDNDALHRDNRAWLGGDGLAVTTSIDSLVAVCAG